MDLQGPGMFFAFIAGLLLLITLYGLYRSTRRAAPTVEETGPYAPVAMTAGAVAQEATQEYLVETIETEALSEDDAAPQN
jgi:hypothetical protein